MVEERGVGQEEEDEKRYGGHWLIPRQETGNFQMKRAVNHSDSWTSRGQKEVVKDDDEEKGRRQEVEPRQQNSFKFTSTGKQTIKKKKKTETKDRDRKGRDRKLIHPPASDGQL